MNTVHKFSLSTSIGEVFLTEMPIGAIIRSVQMQREKPYLWASVDDLAPLVARNFIWTGTGQKIHPHWHYIATVQQPPFVWHLWEVE